MTVGSPLLTPTKPIGLPLDILLRDIAQSIYFSKFIARPKYNFQVANVRKVDYTYNEFKNRFVYLHDQRFSEVQEPVARLVYAAFYSPGLEK